jgi:hypothetical protein
MPDNIILDYPVNILDNANETVYHCPRGAEFFLDEHDIQWVKFFPTNGYSPNVEHMMRTHNILVVRTSQKSKA